MYIYNHKEQRLIAVVKKYGYRIHFFHTDQLLYPAIKTLSLWKIITNQKF
jgi:hypothetical protein